MAALRARNAVVLSGEESVEGTYEAPSAGTDAVLVENLRIQFNPNIIQTDEVTGSLDSRGPIAGGMSVQISYDVYLKGSGSAGAAPEFGELLKACGFAEQVTAAAIPATPEELATGTDTAGATLASAGSTVADAYNGMPIIFGSAGSGTGVDDDTFVADYSGSTKQVTLAEGVGAPLNSASTWQIPINVRYTPASASIPSHSQAIFIDGIEYRFAGCRGNVSFNLTSGQPGRMSFTFTGLFVAKTDTSVPTPTYDTTRPPVWKGGKCKINRLAAAAAALSVDAGNELTLPDNPNATEGFDPAVITRRRATGNIDPAETLVATRDIMTAFRQGAQQIILAQVGTVAGNRYGLVVPAAFYTNQTPGDRNGIATVDVPFACVGEDSWMHLCFY